MALHAWNDPVVPAHAVPVEEMKKNPNFIFAVTNTGGHTGWLDGIIFWNSLAWCERVCLEYVAAMLTINEENK